VTETTPHRPPLQRRLALRLRLAASVFCIAAASACGGGGGSGPGGPGPGPAPVPTNNSYRPHATGDTFSYAGSITQNFVRPPVIVPPIPSPNPTNSATLSFAITQNVKLNGGASFAGALNSGSLIDYNTAETDTESNPTQTTQVTSDDYYAFTPLGAATDVLFAGSNSTDSAGIRVKTLIGSGNGLVDIIPEVAGPLVPANTDAQTITENDPQGSTNTKNINADGTYMQSFSYPDGTTGSATVNADGSGTYSFPLEGPNAGGNSTFAVGTPTTNGSGGSTITITITITYANGLFPPGANPSPIHRTVTPAWFTAPVALYAQTLVNQGRTPLPGTCNVAPSLVHPANSLVQTTTTIDPIFGERDVQTTTTYDEPGIGIACLQLSDVVTQYYDFSGQTYRLIYTTPDGTMPVQITTTSETLGVTAATVIGLSSVGRRSATSAGRSGTASVDRLIAAGAVRSSVAHFQAFLAHQRFVRHALALHSLRGVR